MAPLRIVLGNATIAKYPQGGGHWTVRLQYLLGLRALGHDVHLLALLPSKGSAERDQPLIDAFFLRWRAFGLEDRVILAVLPNEDDPPELASARIIGRTLAETEDLIASADLLWNDCCGLLQPLLSKFRHRVMIDLDPGLLQASLAHKMQFAPDELTWERDVFDHHVFLTCGLKMADDDCLVPRLGLAWQPFAPFAYLPMWDASGRPGPQAPFTAITHWNWEGEVPWQGRTLSCSKRDAYLEFVELPRVAARPFELAAYLGDDDGGDRERLESNDWRIIDPRQRLSTPEGYRQYIADSRAEILCPKPIYTDLRTGWLSDRSISYLASGRPVLAGETGISDHVPTGRGLLTFSTMDEAQRGVAEIDAHYEEHARAARELVESHFDSSRCLQAMLKASGY